MNLLEKKFKIPSLKQSILFISILTLSLYSIFNFLGQKWEISELFSNSITQPRNNSIIVSLFQLIGVVGLFAISFSYLKKINNKYILLLLLLQLILGLFWVFYAILIEKSSPLLLLRDSFPPYSILLVLLLTIGYSDEMWSTIKKMIFPLLITFTAVCFYEIIDAYIKFQFSKRITASGPMYSSIIALFLSYIMILFNKEKVIQHKYLYLTALIFISISFIVLQSRSWLVHCVVLFILFIHNSTNKKYKALKYLFFVLLVVLIFVILFFNFNELFEGIIDRFSNAGDTRSEQLNAFFNQVSFIDLMLGGGTKATYICFGGPYSFIDNQVLLFLFRYGLLPTFIYLFFVVIYPFYRIVKTKKFDLFYLYILNFAWFFSMMGVSIYFNIKLDLSNVLIVISSGRIIYLSNKNKESASL